MDSLTISDFEVTLFIDYNYMCDVKDHAIQGFFRKSSDYLTCAKCSLGARRREGPHLNRGF